MIINLLNDIVEFKQLSDFNSEILLNGKNIYLDLEGKGKTYCTIFSVIKSVQNTKGKLYVFVSNSISNQIQAYNQATIICNNYNYNPKKCKLIVSTSELFRQYLERNSNRLYKIYNGEIKRTFQEKVQFWSIHKTSYNKLKETSYDSHKNIFESIFLKLKSKSKSVKRNFLVIVQYDKNSFINEQELEIFLNDCLVNSKKLKMDFSKYVSWKLNKIKDTENKIFNGDIETFIISSEDIESISNQIYSNESCLKHIFDNFNEESDSLVLFLQTHKFCYEFEKYTTENIKRTKWLSENIHVIYDEIPKLFNTISNSNFVKSINSFLTKSKNKYTFDELCLYNCLPEETRKEIVRVRNSESDTVIRIPLTLYIHKCSNYISSEPFVSVNESKNISKFLLIFKNILILTTERLPSVHLSLYDYTIYEKYYSNDELKELQASEDDLTINIIASEDLDTTKKNHKKFSDFLKKLKSSCVVGDSLVPSEIKKYIEESTRELVQSAKIKIVPKVFNIGKKCCGNDSTIEGIKGTNYLWTSSNLEIVNNWIYPPHPNKVMSYFIDFINRIPSDKVPSDLYQRLLLQSLVDDFDQLIARTIGIRKKRRLQVGLYPIRNNIFISLKDKLNIHAVRLCKYVSENHTFNVVYLQENIE